LMKRLNLCRKEEIQSQRETKEANEETLWLCKFYGVVMTTRRLI